MRKDLRYFLFSPHTRRLRRRVENTLAIVLIILALAFGLATYAAFTETVPFGQSSDVVFWLLNADLVVLLLLLSLIAKRLIALWSGRRTNISGSKTQARLVFLFSIMTALPAVTMTLLSGYFFHNGVQTWFGQRVQTAIYESQAVAEAYLNEHQQVIRADALAMAQDIDRQAELYFTKPEAFEKFIETQSYFRNLPEVFIFSRSEARPPQIIFTSGPTSAADILGTIPDFVMRNADDGGATILTSESEESVQALVRLRTLPDTYLHVGRKIDPVVLTRVNTTREAAEAYSSMRSASSGLQIRLLSVYIVVALGLVLSSIWLGLVLARYIGVPVNGLITAADRVRHGDLSVRVPQFNRLDELDLLALAFNRMTEEIEGQRDALVVANRRLDERRRFTETILEGVSSGVVNIDADGIIKLANSAALHMLGYEQSQALQNRSLREVLPEIGTLLDRLFNSTETMVSDEIHFTEAEGHQRVFLVRIALELLGDQDTGAVITFDDITELQAAQRKAAWADVARRIAHEIKNPLTPIQLSAERLSRKYLKQIKDDPETFEKCTSTIIRHVDDIGRMVNAFSDFARMPEPVFKDEALLPHIRDLVLFHKQARPDISFEISEHLGRSQKDVIVSCDAQQLRQALTNLIQNAIDAVDMQEESKREINVVLRKDKKRIGISINDNGPGLPQDKIAKLTEPYVTYKEKGTGLGLAIVRKIMEDHGGELLVGMALKAGDAKLPGATLTLVFPLES